jgi:putative transposase
MDFMADTLADGRAFRTLNIVDDFSRECVAIEVDRSLPGARVVRVLERLAVTVGLPRILVSDNGPEFAGRTLDAWAYRQGIALRSFDRGSPLRTPTSRASTGSFATSASMNTGLSALRKRRRSLKRGAWTTTPWPHHSLGQQTPAAYAAASCAGPKPRCGACSAAALATTDLAQKPDGLSLSV